jgi:hypothetical protein
MKINKILTKKKSENNTEITTKRTKSEMPIIMRTIDIIKKKKQITLKGQISWKSKWVSHSLNILLVLVSSQFYMHQYHQLNDCFAFFHS